MKAFAECMSKNIGKKAKKVLKEDLSNLGDFSDEEIAMLCNYGKAVHTGTDFDDEVEREVEKLEEGRLASRAGTVYSVGSKTTEEETSIFATGCKGLPVRVRRLFRGTPRVGSDRRAS